jgi:signal transduction histidine kinase
LQLREHGEHGEHGRFLARLEDGQRLVQPHHIDRLGAQRGGALLERGDQRGQRLEFAAQVGGQRVDALLLDAHAGEGAADPTSESGAAPP